MTLPEEIRSRLGVRPRDRVVFEVVNDEVRLRAKGSRLLAGYGAVRPVSKPEDWRSVKDQFEEEMAADAMAGTE